MKFDPIFLAELATAFPDTLSTGNVSRKQIETVKTNLRQSSWPTELMVEKVSRGVYKLPQVALDVMAARKAAAPTQAPALVEAKVTPIKPQSAPVAAEEATLDSKTLVPKPDPNYVAFGNHRDVDTIVKSGQFYPTYISGPTGNGKSTMVEQVCAKNKRPLIRVNLNMMTDEDQLIGSKTLVDGNVQVVEGPVIIAMRLGIPLLLDEVDAGAANTLLCLQPILEGKPYYFKLKNEMIVPAPGFNIFATANTKGKGSDDGRYIGTNILNEAFLERFAVTLNQDYPSASVEKKIVINLMNSLNCLHEEFAESLVKWADAIRKTFQDGGIDETITTRRLVHIVRAFAIFKDKKKAIELCVNRFDDVTRIAFIDLFDKVSVPDPVPQDSNAQADEPVSI